MKYVSGQTKLGELSIPGTHNAGAYRTPLDFAECQDWSPNQQMYNGKFVETFNNAHHSI